MNRSRSLLLLAAWSAAALVLPSCRPSGDAVQRGGTVYPADPPEDGAVVCGTVIDLSTGAPAAKVEVLLPGGRPSRTDDQGRFEIRHVPLGTSGEVRARASDGREGTLQLLPLTRERREVVLHLPAR